ncbi:hypothetical protein [Legionella sp. km772]|uniref:hypothetical protein n=1 Tax=Legionella sp. km772 TaxID=2498111 RepID=UPI000FB37EEC|nr:hypothetical protein [Legionella sp. km772]RUR08449.1 hypothetical protein ELY15_10800 [Legionella sp. km772]
MINEIWGTAESPLQQTLTSLNSIELAELTEKILLCPHSVTFIKPFLLTLSEHLISGLWNKLPSFPMPNRVVFMEVLENTLATLLNNAKNTANNDQQKTMQEHVKQNPPLSSSDNCNNFFKNPEQRSHRYHEEKAVHSEPNPLVKNKS